MAHPLVKTYTAPVPAVAVGVDTETEVCVAEWAGVVAAVKLYAATAVAGADTNSRTGRLVNKGQAGAGAVVPATKAFTNGVNAAADDDTTIPLSVTAADLVVAEGDVLVWQSTHVGTGIADPGGMVKVDLSRT